MGLSVNALPFLFEKVLRSHRNEGQNIGEVLWSAVYESHCGLLPGLFLPTKGEYAFPSWMVRDQGVNVSRASLVSLVQAGLSVNAPPFLFEKVLRSYRNGERNIGEVFWSGV